MGCIHYPFVYLDSWILVRKSLRLKITYDKAIRLGITPMISTLSLMENAESESEVLSIGISIIVLNLGMYLGIPAIVVVGIRKRF